jgi:hypothetical protein
MSDVVNVGWAAPLDAEDSDGNGGLNRELCRAVQTGVRAALQALELPDLPVRVSHLASDEPPHLVIGDMQAAGLSPPQRQAFGLCAGWDHPFPETWDQQWAVLGDLGRRPDFARQWARLNVAAAPESVASAVAESLQLADVPGERGQLLRQSLRYVLASTPYLLRHWRAAARGLDAESLPSLASLFAALTGAVGPTANVVQLHAAPGEVQVVADLMHTPSPAILASYLADQFGPTRAGLLPRLAAVADPATPPGWVEVRAGGRTLDVVPLPPAGSTISAEEGQRPLHRAIAPATPWSVGDGSGNLGHYLAIALTDVLTVEAPRLLSSRSVGLLLRQLAAQWDPDLVSTVREELTDEGVTFALRLWVPNDQRLDSLPVLLRELAAVDAGTLIERIDTAAAAARLRLQPVPA